ncbi:MAG: hypothetical protein FJX77_11985 [Armatimonadetes bacterium]|nr:hypothetical protein [Armatimonadota bacterium]
MSARRIITASISAFLALALLVPVGSEPLPPPPNVVEDYEALGVIQVDLPPAPGDEQDSPWLGLLVRFHQAYVRPEHVWQRVDFLGQPQTTLAFGDTERTWMPLSNFIVVRRYLNLDKSSHSPIPTTRMAMISYARALRELQGARLLPDPDLDKLETQLKARQAELAALRDRLQKEFEENKRNDTTEKLAERNRVASEHGRVTDEIAQIPLLKKHPCRVVEFENKELGNHLFTRGLISSNSAARLDRGKTVFWITRGEGLPLRMVTTANDGRVALFYLIRDIRINAGLTSDKLQLGAPAGARQIVVTGDGRRPNWEAEMEKELQAKVDALAEERQRLQQQQNQRNRPRGTTPRRNK